MRKDGWIRILKSDFRRVYCMALDVLDFLDDKITLDQLDEFLHRDMVRLRGVLNTMKEKQR